MKDKAKYSCTNIISHFFLKADLISFYAGQILPCFPSEKA